MEFGERLKLLRDKAKKSRYQLWKISGVDQAYLSRMENGEKTPSRNTVILVALALLHGSDKIRVEDIEELLMDAGHCPFEKAMRAMTGQTRLIGHFVWASRHY